MSELCIECLLDVLGVLEYYETLDNSTLLEST